MVDLFFGKIIVLSRPTKFYRLGKPGPNKIRPLKLEMVNNTDRDAVMKNLKLLKGTEGELGCLSVRADYTKKRMKGNISRSWLILLRIRMWSTVHTIGLLREYKKRTTPGESHQALTSPNKSFNTINKETNTSM